MDERNVFSVTGDLSELNLNQLPINSTHNTLIRHRNILRESVVKETNCMIAELVISTIKNPVFMEIDMISQSGVYIKSGDCNTGTNACKIKHGFTSSSDFKDFLTTVSYIYSKCFSDELKPYPLILGFDVPESCSTSIMGEINTAVKECLPKKNKSLSLMCGEKIKKLDRKMAFFDLPNGSTEINENMFRLNKTGTVTFDSDISKESLSNGVNLEGSTSGENSTTDTDKFECSEKKLKDLMGKIIFRTKSKVLQTELEKNKYLYVNYFSSKKVYKSGTMIKYPTFKNDYGKNMTRVYPGISGSSLLMSPFSFQQQISLDIMKKVTELLTKKGDNAGITGFETFAGFAQEEFEGFGKNVTAVTEISTLDLTKITVTDLNDKEKTKTKSTLTSVNFISYNYPVKKKKPQEYIDLQESFYNFYNPNPNPNPNPKSDVNNRLTHFKTVTNSIINVNESPN